MPDGSQDIQVRRRVYVSALAVGLFALFALAAWTVFGQGSPTSPYLSLVPIVAAVLGLLWLRPRPRVYAAGVACLAAALVILWVWRPDGPLVDSSIPLIAYVAAVVMFVFFPVSWMLLAKAVASWRASVVSYLVAGFAFVLEFVIASVIWSGTSGVGLSWLLALFVLNWPLYSLVMAGAFGHRIA
jgi:drug/metabolite transporter (DMT)-like permease